MTAAPIALNELEQQSIAIFEDANRLSGSFTSGITSAIAHAGAVAILSRLASRMAALLKFFHEPAAIHALQHGPEERVLAIAESLSPLPAKLTATMDLVASVDDRLGRWGSLYRPRAKKIRLLSAELDSHIRALALGPSRIILLSKVDQDRLITSMLDEDESTTQTPPAFLNR